MQLADLGPLPLSILASLVVAVLLLGVRIFVMQRIQQRRQRENRQETERLKSLVAAYRSLADSFSPAAGQHRCLVGVQAAFLLGVWADLGLLVAAALGVVLIMRPGQAGARVTRPRGAA